MDWGSSMPINSEFQIFVVAISLVFTYFVFEQGNSILSQLRDLKTEIVNTKNSKSFFKKHFIIPYFEDKHGAALTNVIISYISFSACILVFYLNLDFRILSLIIIITTIWVLLNFSLDNDALPLYKALFDSENLSDFLEKLDIKEQTEVFNKISKLYKEASSPRKTELEIVKLIERIFDELPKI